MTKRGRGRPPRHLYESSFAPEMEIIFGASAGKRADHSMIGEFTQDDSSSEEEDPLPPKKLRINSFSEPATKAANVVVALPQPYPAEGSNISPVSTAQPVQEYPECTNCEGKGKLSSKHTVKGHSINRGGKEIQRREHEKTSWKRCKRCLGDGRVNLNGKKPRRTKHVKGLEVQESQEPQTAETEVPELLLQEFEQEGKRLTERDCSTCAEERPIAEYGYKLTGTYTHAREICQDCVVQWVEAKIEEGEWNTITCPECDSPLEYTDISQILSLESESFKHYNDLATKACLNSMGEYRHYLSPTYKAGQLHSGGADSPIFICRSCGHKSCTIHNVPWHEGELCADYDVRIAHAKEVATDNAASEAEVAKMKVCPKCKAPFKKNGGCDHMTCTRCRFEFCHLCLGDYAMIREKGNAFHGEDCKCHTKRL